LIVYHDHRDAAHSITQIGLDYGWAILFSVLSVILLFVGAPSSPRSGRRPNQSTWSPI
jgi:hypothetical protein